MSVGLYVSFLLYPDTLVAFRRFRFILSRIALLILPSSFFELLQFLNFSFFELSQLENKKEITEII